MLGKHHKLAKYHKYLHLTDKQKKKLISKAEQDTYSQPNPQGEHVFPQKNFVHFHVLDQNDKMIKLATFRYPARGKPIAIVLMFHGLNSHIGHGAHMAHKFSQHNIQTVGFDHRGFGQSEGTPGYVRGLQYHIEDCLKWVRIVQDLYPKMPLFCLGLSMGGMASYYLTLTHRDCFQGAILMAPALKNQVGGFLVKVSHCFKSILPQHTKLTPPIYGKASRNPTITEAVKQDPYAYKGRVNLATTDFLVSTMEQSPQTFKNYHCPFLIVQGGLDKLVNPMVAFQLFEQSAVSEQDKDILFYEGMWHDIWHQQQIWEIVNEIIKWIDKRLQKAKFWENKIVQ